MSNLSAGGPAEETAGRWQLAGRRALVTGGTRGIGRAVAEEFLALGAAVYIVARDGAAVAQTLAEWRAQGWTEVGGTAADTTTDEGRLAAVSGVTGAGDGRLDCLVNNAGGNVRKRALDYLPGEWDALLARNLTSAWELSRSLHPLLKAAAAGRARANGDAGGSTIINVGSVAGLTGIRTGVPYGASKAGMSQMTRGLAGEWAADGIRVNAVAPWYIRTPLAETVLKDPAYAAEVVGRTPLRRVHPRLQ